MTHAIDYVQRRADLQRLLDVDFADMIGNVEMRIQEQDALIAASAERIEAAIKGVRAGEASVLRQYERDKAALVEELERIKVDRQPVEAELRDVDELLAVRKGVKK